MRCSEWRLLLDGVDQETTGYHTNCYLNFTLKLDRLKSSTSGTPDQPSATQQCSLRKLKTDQAAACSLFPNKNKKMHILWQICMKSARKSQKDYQVSNIEEQNASMECIELKLKLSEKGTCFAKDACWVNMLYGSKIPHEINLWISFVELYVGNSILKVFQNRTTRKDPILTPYKMTANAPIHLILSSL